MELHFEFALCMRIIQSSHRKVKGNVLFHGLLNVPLYIAGVAIDAEMNEN